MAEEEAFNRVSVARAQSFRIVHTESSLGWGGQEHRILAELVGFQQRGCEIGLVAPTESEIFRRAKETGVRVQPLTMTRVRFFWNALALARWLRRERVEVLNPHSSRDAWVAGLAGRIARVPLIVRTRHFDVPIPNPRLSRYVYQSLADHVLTTSPRITDHLRKLFDLAEDRISTVPTGVDLQRFSPDGPRAKLTSTDLPVIGMISVVRRAKGHETFLRAALILKNDGTPAHYVLVGEGPHRPHVERMAREMGLSACLTFIGHREDVPEILRALDVLVIPSLHEGIPQVGLQALATKTPLIGSDIGGIPSIIRPGQTGRLVPPGDPAALAGTIRETLQDAALTRALCENGRALVEREHSLEKMLDKLEELYRRYIPK